MSAQEPQNSTTSAEFFEAKYSTAADPWDFAHSAYEQARYAATIAALDRPRYTHAFEPACSIGELTNLLAARCDRIDATDISATAVARAAARCRNSQNAHFHVGALPHLIPDGRFDLLVFSEIGYYFDESTLRALAQTLVAHMVPGGCFLAIHWLGHSKDHTMNGDRVHDILRDTPGLTLTHSDRQPGFRLDRWRVA